LASVASVASVQQLVASINDTGLWNGCVGHQDENGEVEIACRHTLVAAAIEAGIKQVEIRLGHYTDEQMVRIYATENAAQRGELGLAMAGAVASAVRYLVKGLLKGDEHVRQICLTSEKASLSFGIWCSSDIF
jgi:ParB-like chromosome segregation protein Spo0J